jgi:hypothetical protein
MPVTANRERGQTIPVWTLGIATLFALMFFTVNYANVIRWHIRAQNAADSAASAGIATDANMNNQVNMLLYAATVDEARMRYLLQAMVNTVYHRSGCGGSQASCDAALGKLKTAYATAQTNYATVQHQLENIESISKGGLNNSPAAAAGLASSNCTKLDCGFTYTATVDQTHEVVDVVACKNVPTLLPKILGLASTNTFKALGRSAATLAQVHESFVPGSVNPKTGVLFQPNETPTGVGASSDLTVNFATLNVQLSWFVAGVTHPGTLPAGYGCS